MILTEQSFLDYESYKGIMGLISAHVSLLTQLKNEESFEERIDLLRRIKKDTSTFEESGSELDFQQ